MYSADADNYSGFDGGYNANTTSCDKKITRCDRLPRGLIKAAGAGGVSEI